MKLCGAAAAEASNNNKSNVLRCVKEADMTCFYRIFPSPALEFSFGKFLMKVNLRSRKVFQFQGNDKKEPKLEQQIASERY